MSRSPFILLMVLVASSVVVNAQRRYYDDFRGQSFCSKRQGSRDGQCCSNRIDECSVPIAGNNLFLPRALLVKQTGLFPGTLCYCDEFCDQHINPDCCPDYENVCKGISEPIIEKCEIAPGIFIGSYNEQKVNCNLW